MSNILKQLPPLDVSVKKTSRVKLPVAVIHQMIIDLAKSRYDIDITPSNINFDIDDTREYDPTVVGVTIRKEEDES